MAFDLAAWALTIVVGYAVGNRTLTLLGANRLRAGDRIIIATWIGSSILALVLLSVSLFRPLSPATSVIVAAILVAAALATRDARVVTGGSRVPPEAPIPVRAVVAGIAVSAIGAAALASDPVTLYDSLVYHVGMMRWLREYGTVPGLALIHNRLGHVSAWFALGAAFDAGPFTDRRSSGDRHRAYRGAARLRGRLVSRAGKCSSHFCRRGRQRRDTVAGRSGERVDRACCLVDACRAPHGTRRARRRVAAVAHAATDPVPARDLCVRHEAVRASSRGRSGVVLYPGPW
jgi:hypothetical protein